MSTCDLQIPTASQTSYVFAEQANTVACLYAPFHCWSLSSVFPHYLPSLYLYHTFQSFPVLLLCVGHHPICIALGLCFRIEHRQVVLLLPVGNRCHQIAGDKLRETPMCTMILGTNLGLLTSMRCEGMVDVLEFTRTVSYVNH